MKKCCISFQIQDNDGVGWGKLIALSFRPSDQLDQKRHNTETRLPSAARPYDVAVFRKDPFMEEQCCRLGFCPSPKIIHRLVFDNIRVVFGRDANSTGSPDEVLVCFRADKKMLSPEECILAYVICKKGVISNESDPLGPP